MLIVQRELDEATKRECILDDGVDWFIVSLESNSRSNSDTSDEEGAMKGIDP